MASGKQRLKASTRSHHEVTMLWRKFKVTENTNTTTNHTGCYTNITLSELRLNISDPAEVECESISRYTDRCNFVSCTEECHPEEGLVDYLKFLYCGTSSISPAVKLAGGMTAVVLMLALLFVALGTVADEFFVPALTVISETLGISDNVAGVVGGWS
jgi:hypothetical protein